MYRLAGQISVPREKEEKKENENDDTRLNYEFEDWNIFIASQQILWIRGQTNWVVFTSWFIWHDTSICTFYK